MPAHESPLGPGVFGVVRLLVGVAVMAMAVVFLLGRLVYDRGLGSSRCTNANDHRLARVRHFSQGDGDGSPLGRARRFAPGADFPFSACDPRSVSPGSRPSRASTVWCVRMIASPVVLVSCSTRAATLKMSPIRVIRACCRRRWCPRSPPVEGTQAPSMYSFVRLSSCIAVQALSARALLQGTMLARTSRRPSAAANALFMSSKEYVAAARRSSGSVC